MSKPNKRVKHQTHASKAAAFLHELINFDNILNVAYRNIDVNTQKSDLNLRKVRGSIRLGDEARIVLPIESNLIVEQFLDSKF